jgi:hypothetical protein
LALRPPRESWRLLAGSAELDLDALRQRTVIVTVDSVRAGRSCCNKGAVCDPALRHGLLTQTFFV